VFLGNLPPDCRVRDIEEFFNKYGKVRNVLIKQGKYAFAEFDRVKDAEDAVYDMHGKRMLGNKINVEFAKGPKKGDRRAPWVSKYGAPIRTKYVLEVHNLSSRISWQDLKDLFRKAGEVCFAEAHTERRNLGRVELQTREDLERVIKKYQGYEINGRKLELIENVQRSNSRSTSRSRSQSRESQRKRSRSSSKSRSRSTSRTREVDLDDQDVKRKRKRTNSRDSRNSNSKKTHSSRSSRSRRSLSNSKSPSRKLSREMSSEMEQKGSRD